MSRSSFVKSCFVRHAAYLSLAASLLASIEAQAFDPTISKLHGLAPASGSGGRAGMAAAINETWIAVGAPEFDDAGAVFTYSATTGQFVRKLRPAGLTPGDAFGMTLAIFGNQLLVGAPRTDGEKGKAYLINLNTGAVVREFINPAAVAEDSFGYGVGLSPRFAAIGAYGENDGSGAAYLFDLSTNSAPTRLAPPVADFGQFGQELEFSDNLLVISEPYSAEAAPSAGTVFVYNALTAERLHSFNHSLGASATFGYSLSVSGGKVLIGSRNATAGSLYDVPTGAFIRFLPLPVTGFIGSVSLDGNLALFGRDFDAGNGTASGAVYVVDARTGALLRKIVAPDGQQDDFLGESVALSGNRAVLGVSGDDDVGGDAGAAYFVRPLSSPMPLDSVAKIGDFAPGVAQADFASFGAAHLNGDGEVLFGARLKGPGSNGGTDTGAWSALASPPGVNCAMKSRHDFPLLDDFEGQTYTGVRAGSVGSPLLNHASFGLFQAALTGSSVTTLNNRALIRDPGRVPVLRTDRPIGAGAVNGPSWGNARIQSMTRVAQSSNADFCLVACKLRPGVTSVTLNNDTGILVLNHAGQVQNTKFREGQSLFGLGGPTLGQFLGTVGAGPSPYFAFRAFLIESGEAPKQAVCYGLYTANGNYLQLQGEDPGEVGGATNSSFTGESMVNNWTHWKTVLTGAGVTSLNNVSLWGESPGLILRTGDQIEPGLFVSRIEKYWAMSSNRAVIQVLLRGPSVTPANNRALYLWWEDAATEVNAFLRLMRTGQIAEGCGLARIGAIQQVAAEPTGRYAILASLTGAPASANQALFTGNASAGENTVDKRVLRQAFMVLRKGRSYQSPTGQTTTIKSLSFANTTDTDGVGNKGMGQVINANGQIVINIQFNNLAREIMVGIP